VWLQWSSVVISMPAIMSVVTVNAAYIFDPDLGNNRWFVFVVIVVVMWCMTAVAARGVKESAWITNAAVVVGIVVPGLVLAILGLLYVLQGRPDQMTGAGRDLLPESRRRPHARPGEHGLPDLRRCRAVGRPCR
jgi:glutamate:GABA antiporter